MQNSQSPGHSDQAVGLFIPSPHSCLEFQIRESRVDPKLMQKSLSVITPSQDNIKQPCSSWDEKGAAYLKDMCVMENIFYKNVTKLAKFCNLRNRG